MKIPTKSAQVKTFPIIVERWDDGYYTVECPIFEGCYTQGKTIDQALKNIREVIEICLEEQKVLPFGFPIEMSIHNIALV
jgi:predicted RNase H-like HicB family nuclease